MYQMSYVVNLSIASSVFYLLSVVFPPEGLGNAEPWSEGAAEADITPDLEEKGEHVVEVECTPGSPRL
jgi:hypothetical protein